MVSTRAKANPMFYPQEYYREQWGYNGYNNYDDYLRQGVNATWANQTASNKTALANATSNATANASSSTNATANAT